ncbi:unnamed protein product [Moneuplotes crassus]|uniref:Uncharacterized protein n=1 Tax=Euplotes crassus TaxID=5936 RepID=A0AAD1Y049_EUPCR|nr:unnamed protein product [Moneuplotes crassus]
MWRKVESPADINNHTKTNSIKREGPIYGGRENNLKGNLFMKTESIYTTKAKKKTKTIDPKNAEKELKKANELVVVDITDLDKENIHVNKIDNLDARATFSQIKRPVLSIQRKYLNKIEKEISIKRYTDSGHNQRRDNNLLNISQDRRKKSISNTENTKNPASTNKTADLFTQAREALSNLQVTNVKETKALKEKVPRMREVLPKQKRTGLLRKGTPATHKRLSQNLKSPPKSPKSKVEIPFSKNRYSKEPQKEDLTLENKKKAIQYLKTQKASRHEKKDQKKILMDKRKKYTEQVRRQNKEKLQKKKLRNSSIDDTKERRGKQPSAPRSKSEDVRTKPFKVVRKHARNRLRQMHRSEAKPNENSHINQKDTNTLSVERDERKNTIEQKVAKFPEMQPNLPPKGDNKVQINVDIASKFNQREIINLNMDHSAQIHLTEEEETKYMKTPELNLKEKYSHKNISENKISGKSTEKDLKTTKILHSSHKKKSLKVSKEVVECKRNLIKLQKKSEYLKRKKIDQETQQKELERRKQNIASLNTMLKKRNQSFRRKKRKQEKLMKKDAINFDKPPGASFSKKVKRKKIKVKNIKRNQTFTNLSNKSPGDTMNTTKNHPSSNKKKFTVSVRKKLTYKKMNESLKTNTSSRKLRSDNKLGAKSVNTSQYFYPNRGNINAHKKMKAIKSESKKYVPGKGTHFNDISEIKEFNMTDEEESLINSSILKNIEEHESLRQTEKLGKESLKKQKMAAKKTIQSTKKKHKKPAKKKMKFISSSKKAPKRANKFVDKEKTDKSLKKRKVIFHSSKLKEVSPIERITRGSQYLEESMDPRNDYKNIESSGERFGQIKKVELSIPSILNGSQSDELPCLKDCQEDSEIRGYAVNEGCKKVENIDSEEFLGLLSSNIKQEEIKSSSNRITDPKNLQHIDFTDKENLHLSGYHSPGVDSPSKNSSIHEMEESHSVVHWNIDSVKDNLKDLLKTQKERNGLILGSNLQSENQTVINCTQSNQESASEHQEELQHDQNNTVDKSSPESSPIPQDFTSVREVEQESPDESAEEHHNQKVFEYLHQQSDQDLAEPGITSKNKAESSSSKQLDANLPNSDHHSSSNRDLSEPDMDEEEIEKFLNEPPAHDKSEGFDNTLTNMRLAFGSEKHIRENSVKTLEKIGQIHIEEESGEKTDEKSNVFEKNSFQEYSLKKFTELMNVKNMKNFQTTIQKTFREYNKNNFFTNSDKKASKLSSTPKKSSCISPRKFTMKDLELDRIGYEKMKENSEKKTKFIQNMLGSCSSQNKQSTSSILYKTNLSAEKCRREINMEDLSDDQSSKNMQYKTSSPHKTYQLLNNKAEKEEVVINPQNLDIYESPKKSAQGIFTSCKKHFESIDQTSQDQYEVETPSEDDNIETVKHDSSRLRSQKRGLPMENSATSKEETPKCAFTGRIIRTDENCNTVEKYIVGDCFTDEKNYEKRLRNAVTSAKKINPIQILREVKSPDSSYISSTKNALAEEYLNENDRINFEISEQKYHAVQGLNDKENIGNNHNINIQKFDYPGCLKSSLFQNKLQDLEQDYNALESPEESNHKHSKSRSRTKEKSRSGCGSEQIDEILEVDREDDKTCMMIDFNSSPEPTKRVIPELEEETTQSIEWIIANNINAQKRDEICKLVDGESRNISPHTKLPQSESESKGDIEVEEVPRVKFGNPLIDNNILEGKKDDHEESNLAQYVDCIESVESSANKSAKEYAEKELMKNPEETSEHMTDEILSMMLFNDIHDCPMHPIRENNFVDYFKDKYPFNRDLGIDTTEVGTNKYIDQLCDYLEKYHLDLVYNQLLKPVYVDPLEELKKLQALDDFYNDEVPESDKNSQANLSNKVEEPDTGLVLPQQLFYEFEEVRKQDLYKNIEKCANPEYKENEIEDKVRYTFIHDKVVFDAFNNALSHYGERSETPRPWIKQKASFERYYNVDEILNLFEKSKKKVSNCISVCAGTRKIPPPSVLDTYSQMNDDFGDTLDANQLSDEERLQQLREERLSLMLREIQDEDYKWNKFEACEIQIKLDLADMVLETLVCEVIEILNK